MDLIDDLGNDLALAFLVEKQHRNKIDSKEAKDLIGRIKSALRSVEKVRDREQISLISERSLHETSH